MQLPIAPVVVFGAAGIDPDHTLDLSLVRKASNFRTFAQRHGIDLSRGIRSMVTTASTVSLRALMGLPAK